MPLLPNNYQTYYEPFLGSGALYLKLKPKTAILNDNDPNIINLWYYAFKNPHLFTQQVLNFEQKIFLINDQKAQKLVYQQLLIYFNQLPISSTKSAVFMF
ncbi:MAG: DNA adenine methylase [Candidatus Phytoplasma pyri]